MQQRSASRHRVQELPHTTVKPPLVRRFHNVRPFSRHRIWRHLDHWTIGPPRARRPRL
ncbi:uncharacterized protein EI90DRAFT_3049863 [Cantharellus anzutake]|uniref:uncharacterized protein n=1 Tax=Cantharellus anzutake TaxID=1750568 RepID=UPI001904F358|nr:uncharacterized protein EI90DRAFT_3049863 [Cantharellus anzutake]KAF8334690.1 hypothetical protein EI90DRAFT_3049863 [Cantharellus anzutake]